MITYNFHPDFPPKNFAIDFHLRQFAKKDLAAKEKALTASSEKVKELLMLPKGFQSYILSSGEEINNKLNPILGGEILEFKQLDAQGEEAKTNTNPKAIFIELTNKKTGFQLSEKSLSEIIDKNPESFLIVDANFSFPYFNETLSKVDLIFFKLDRSFGIEGEGLLCISGPKAEYSFKTNGIQLEQASDEQLFLTGKVIEDYLARGLAAIKGELKYKAILVYQLFNTNPLFEPVVTEKADRSDMLMTAKVKDGQHIKEKLNQLGIEVGVSSNNDQISIANSPNYSKEAYEKLVDSFG